MDAVFRLVAYAVLLLIVTGGYWLILFVLWRGYTALGRAVLLGLLVLGGLVASRSGLELAAAIDEILEGEGR